MFIVSVYKSDILDRFDLKDTDQQFFTLIPGHPRVASWSPLESNFVQLSLEQFKASDTTLSFNIMHISLK